jgi:HD superfamily phosphohydrolase YqeK
MSKAPLEMAEEYADGNVVKQTAWEDGFVAGISHQIAKEVDRQMRIETVNKRADEIWERATAWARRAK